MVKNFILLVFIIQANNFLSQKRNLQESPDDIIILHLNDVHCGVNDTIGYDGFVQYRKELNKTYPNNIITVDVGDHAQGGTLGSISDGTAIINILNKIGFDVAILGNHEFDYGIDQLINLNENITSNYISANFCYKKNKSTIFNSSKIIERCGKKIAFIGVVTPLTFSKTYLSTIKDSNGEAVYDFLNDNNAQELYDKVQENINKLKNDENADYVILLTHLGMDLEQYTSNGLLSKLENVDAVLDGHTHLIYNKTAKDKNNKEIHISQTGTKLQSIGKLIIKNNGTILSEIIENITEPSDKSDAKKLTRGKKEIWVDTDTNNFLNNLWKEYEDILNIYYGHSNYKLEIRPEGTSDSHYIYCRYKECTVGNLVADSFKWAGNSEVAIVNGGSIRNSINEGNLTRGQIIEAAPFFNDIITKKVPGKCSLEAIELGTSNYPDAAGAFPQVSGINYDIDTSINSSVLKDSNGLFLDVPGKRRVSNVKINGKNLDLDKNYTISMSSFVGSGGDGYTMFTNYEVFNESLLTDSDSIALYIKDELEGEIPEKYKDFQGRINFVNNTEISIESTAPNNQSVDINKFIPKKKSRGGLSTGGIIAIMIPCLILIIGAAILGIMCSRNADIPGKPISVKSESGIKMGNDNI